MSAEDWGDMLDGQDLEWVPIVPEWAERNLRLRKWRTKDGHEIPLKAMSDQHIKNSIKFIEEHGEHCIFGLGGEWEEILINELARRAALEEE